MSVVIAKTSLIQYEQTAIQAFREVEDVLVSIETFKEELTAQESRTKMAIS